MFKILSLIVVYLAYRACAQSYVSTNDETSIVANMIPPFIQAYAAMPTQFITFSNQQLFTMPIVGGVSNFLSNPLQKLAWSIFQGFTCQGACAVNQPRTVLISAAQSDNFATWYYMDPVYGVQFVYVPNATNPTQYFYNANPDTGVPSTLRLTKTPYRPYSRGWFTAALSAKGTLTTASPFYSTSTNALTYAFTQAWYNSTGGLEGVAESSFELTYLNQLLQQVNTNANSVLYIMQAPGQQSWQAVPYTLMAASDGEILQIPNGAGGYTTKLATNATNYFIRTSAQYIESQNIATTGTFYPSSLGYLVNVRFLSTYGQVKWIIVSCDSSVTQVSQSSNDDSVAANVTKTMGIAAAILAILVVFLFVYIFGLYFSSNKRATMASKENEMPSI